MYTNMTFRMDQDVKRQMTEICKELGITASSAFNVFANSFVRAKGFPYQVTLQEPAPSLTKAQMLADTDAMLSAFADDYKRMAE